MNEAACRELYPEERLLFKFLDDLGFDLSDQENKRKLQKLLADMEMVPTGARQSIRTMRDENNELQNVIRELCYTKPLNELLTSNDEPLRRIGLELKQGADHIVEGLEDLDWSSCESFYDYCEKYNQHYPGLGTGVQNVLKKVRGPFSSKRYQVYNIDATKRKLRSILDTLSNIVERTGVTSELQPIIDDLNELVGDD